MPQTCIAPHASSLQVGAPGQYGRVRSRVMKRTLNPKWKQRLELRLAGGVMNDQGEYDNKEAPFTGMRLELWDSDALTRDDFFGEVRCLHARQHARVRIRMRCLRWRHCIVGEC